MATIQIKQFAFANGEVFDAPSWATHITADADGAVKVWAAKPELLATYGMYYKRFCRNAALGFVGDSIYTQNLMTPQLHKLD